MRRSMHFLPLSISPTQIYLKYFTLNYILQLKSVNISDSLTENRKRIFEWKENDPAIHTQENFRVSGLWRFVFRHKGKYTINLRNVTVQNSTCLAAQATWTGFLGHTCRCVHTRATPDLQSFSLSCSAISFSLLSPFLNETFKIIIKLTYPLKASCIWWY